MIFPFTRLVDFAIIIINYLINHHFNHHWKNFNYILETKVEFFIFNLIK